DGISGTQGSSGGGDGITASLTKADGAGDATYILNIDSNQIYDVDGGLGGIVLRSSGGGSANPATLEATVTNNTVAAMGSSSVAAMYALVGGNGAGDFGKMGLSMTNNHLDASGATFGDNALLLDQTSSDAHSYLPGY